MEARVTDADNRIVEGHAAVFGEVDSYGTDFRSGAFADTISERMPKKLIRFLWQHKSEWPLGTLMDLSEDSTGLAYRAKVSKTSYGDDALVLLRDEAVNTASFGFRTEAWSEDEEDVDEYGWPIRHIERVKLYELGPVTFAANENTSASAQRSMERVTDALSMFRRGDDPTRVVHMVDALRQTVDEIRGMFTPCDLAMIEKTLGVVREQPAELSSGQVQQFLSELRASATLDWN